MNNNLEVNLLNKNDDQVIKSYINYFNIINIFLKYKNIIIIFNILNIIGTIVFIVVSMILPSDKSYLPTLYTSKAIIIINSNNNGLSNIFSSTNLGGLASMAGVTGALNANGELAKILSTSNTTLDALNEKYDITKKYKIKNQIRSKTREAIKKRLSVDFDESSNILTISYTDIDPLFVKNIVNSIVDVLKIRFNILNENRALEQKYTIELKLSEVESSIVILENRAKEFQKRYGVANVEALATEQVTIVARLRSELILKDMEIANYSKITRIDDPLTKKLRDERMILEAKINELEFGNPNSSINNRVMPSQQEMPKIAFDYARLQRDLLVQTEVYKMLNQQYEMAKLSSTGQDSVFQVLELGEVPDKKSGPVRSKIVIISTLVGVLLSLIGVLMFESIRSLKLCNIDN